MPDGSPCYDPVRDGASGAGLPPCPTIPGGTVTTPPISTVTGTTTSVENQDTFCQKYPKNPVCLKGGDEDATTFGGACTGGFQCTGDAALCAAARATNETVCALKKLEVTDETFSTIGTNAATGQNPSDHPIKGKTDVSVGTFNQSNPFGGGCPSDYSISTSFGAVEIPFSAACGVLTLMGQLMVGLTMLCCALWLVRG
jgi:hypothetical protein